MAPIPAAPPSPQEITRKLSVHNTRSPKGSTTPSNVSSPPDASTRADGLHYDDVLKHSPELASLSAHASGILASTSGSAQLPSSSGIVAPLSSIAERGAFSGEDSELDEEAEDEFPVNEMAQLDLARAAALAHGGSDETVIKSGYLLKKGEKRKNWKKRWFVLRPAHLAVYKTSAEYKLLRLLSLDDVHSCTPCQLKNHDHAFGLVLPQRTFYLQPSSAAEQQSWVSAIHRALEAKALPPTPHTLTGAHGHASSSAASTGGASGPIPIPPSHARSPSRTQMGVMLGLSSGSQQTPGIISSSPTGRTSHVQTASSDSEDGVASAAAAVGLVRTPSSPPHHPPHAHVLGSPTKLQQAAAAAALDPTKTVLTGYLMKCGSKRKTWRKRWFVLSGEKLWYSASHMEHKAHRQFALSEILDALEVDVPVNYSHHHWGPTSGTGNNSNTQGNSASGTAGGGPLSPGSQYQPAASSVSGSGFGDEDGMSSSGPGASYTFKIVTTKKNLLLCAPSEEEELQWLSAVRALIARKVSGGVGASSSGSQNQGDASASAAAGTGTTSTGALNHSNSTAGGFRAKVRRMSTSGGGGGGGGGGGVFGVGGGGVSEDGHPH